MAAVVLLNGDGGLQHAEECGRNGIRVSEIPCSDTLLLRLLLLLLLLLHLLLLYLLLLYLLLLYLLLL